MSVATASIAGTFADMVRAELAERERTYPDRLFRSVSRAIDNACDQVELVNLAGGGPCPQRVSSLLAQLQTMAGEPVSGPLTSIEAHDELMRLSCVLLGRPDGDLDYDIEAAPVEAER